MDYYRFLLPLYDNIITHMTLSSINILRGLDPSSQLSHLARVLPVAECLEAGAA